MRGRPNVPALIVPSVADDAGLDVYTWRALCHVARRAGTEGGTYRGGGHRAARLCRMSLRQWRRAIRALVGLGVLRVVEETPGWPTVYSYTGAPQAPVTDIHRCPTGTRPVTDRHTKESLEGVPFHASRRVAARRVPKRPRKDAPKEATSGDGWPPTWAHTLAQAWTEESGGIVGTNHIGGAIKRLQGRYSFPAVEKGLRGWLKAGNARFKPATFVRDAGQWCDGNEASPPEPEPTGPVFSGPRKELAARRAR